MNLAPLQCVPFTSAFLNELSMSALFKSLERRNLKKSSYHRNRHHRHKGREYVESPILKKAPRDKPSFSVCSSVLTLISSKISANNLKIFFLINTLACFLTP